MSKPAYEEDPIELPLRWRWAPSIAVAALVASAAVFTLWALDSRGRLDLRSEVGRVIALQPELEDTGDIGTERAWQPVDSGPKFSLATAVRETEEPDAEGNAIDSAHAAATDWALHRELQRATDDDSDEGDPPGYISAEVVIPRSTP